MEFKTIEAGRGLARAQDSPLCPDYSTPELFFVQIGASGPTTQLVRDLEIVVVGVAKMNASSARCAIRELRSVLAVHRAQSKDLCRYFSANFNPWVGCRKVAGCQ